MFLPLTYRIWLVLTLIVLLAGCQTVGGWFSRDESLPPAELIDINQTLSVKMAWSSKVVGPASASRSGIRPVFSDNQIWVADNKGALAAVDAISGRISQRFETGLKISAGPVLVSDSVLLGTYEGDVVRLDAATGSVIWRQRVSSEVLAAPLLADGMVVVRVLDGRIYGFEYETGERAWVYDRAVPVLTLRGNSAPVARAGRVYIGFDDGVVAAIRASDGSLLWEQRVSEPEGRTELERMTDIDGPMAIVGTELYVVTYKGRMASLAIESGRLLWVKDVSAEQGLSLRRTELAVADKEDAIWLIDRRNSTTLWRETRLERRDITRPVFLNEYLVTMDFEGYLHWLATSSGEFVARSRAGNDPALSAPLVVGNTLYVLDVGGRLSAWTAAR